MKNKKPEMLYYYPIGAKTKTKVCLRIVYTKKGVKANYASGVQATNNETIDKTMFCKELHKNPRSLSDKWWIRVKFI
jgi:hypothetical protein